MALQVSAQKYDRSLLLITLLLVAIGTVMVFSSSTDISMDRFGSGTFYFRRHLFRVFVGLVAMFIAMFVDYRMLKRFAAPLLVISIALLVTTKVCYLVEGNRFPARWLSVGLFSLQTSDLGRFAIIVYLATYIDKQRDRLKDFVYGFLPPVVMTALVMALIIIQPDFSTAVIIGIIAITLLFMGGARLTHLLATGSVALAVLIPVLLAADYRIERLKSFFASGGGLQGANYQVQQSLISLGNGGITGLGLGESMGKNLFLPTPYTDFILSIIGEEFGFVGVFVIITLFLALFQRAVRISKRCADVFGIMLGMGLSIQIVLYAFANSAVVSAVVPTTGLPMPFISFGGTGLVINLMSVGMLLNISLARRTVKHRKAAKILFE